MHTKMFTHVVLTMTLESVFKFRKLFITPIPIELQLLYLAHTCLRQDLSMLVKLIATVTLTLTSEPSLRFQNLCEGFLNYSELIYPFCYTCSSYIWYATFLYRT